MSTEAKFDRSAWWVLPVALLGVLLAACPEEEVTPSAEDVSEGADVTDTADDPSDGDSRDGGADTDEPEDAHRDDAGDSDLSDTPEDAGPEDVAADLPCEPHIECVRGNVYSNDCVDRTLLERCESGSYCVDGACRTTSLGCHEDAVWEMYEGEPRRHVRDCFPHGRCEEAAGAIVDCNDACDGRVRCEDERAVTGCGADTWIYQDCGADDDVCAPFLSYGPAPGSYCHDPSSMHCVGDDIYIDINLYRSCGSESCVDWGPGPTHCTCPPTDTGSRCYGEFVQSYDCDGPYGPPDYCDGRGCRTRVGSFPIGDIGECCDASSWRCDGDTLYRCSLRPIDCEHGCVADPDGPHCCDPATEECE